jgi:hypothetical protein
MLGQQTAMAAYVCAMPPAAMEPMAAMSATASVKAMRSTCPEMHQPLDQVVCNNHCAPQVTTQAPAHVASVPGNGLTALPPMLLAIATGTCQSSNAPERRYRQQTPPPPPSKLFCSLQI